jgi:C-terminal processing protease CtpA/Prc
MKFLTQIKLLKTSLILVLFCSLIAQAEHPRNKWLTTQQILKDVDVAETAYKRIHPGYLRYTSEQVLDNAWQNIRDKAIQLGGSKLGDFYLDLSTVLTLIRCDHTKVELNKALSKQRNITPVYLPFKWQIVAGKAIITNTQENSGLSYGDELLSVDGRSIDSMTEILKKYIPVDGYTDAVKEIYMADSGEHMGGAVDHFGAMLWNPSKTVDIKIRNNSGEIKDLILNRVTHKDSEAMLEYTSTDFVDSVEFSRIGEDGAYLKIDSFINYRKEVNPDKIYDPIFKAINKENRKYLILDVRNNGGGSSEAKTRLLAHLIDKNFRTVKRITINTLDFEDTKQYLWTWDKSALNPNRLGFNKNPDGTYDMRPFVMEELQTVKPDKIQFKGQLIVLTSKSNSSASTNLLAALKNHREVTMIGEETGGSIEGVTAGVIFFMTLPESELRTRLPALRHYNDIDNFEIGKGIKPDINIEQNIDAFKNKQDIIYQAAVKYAQKNTQ